MFSIQKWFAKDDQFLALLAASAQAGSDSVQTLKGIMAKPDGGNGLEELAERKRRDKEITGRITTLLARTSITSLDPEDIEAISEALYKIPKTVHKFAERYLITSSHLNGVDFTAQIDLAERATATVTAMIKELEKSQFERVNLSNEQLHVIEGEGDRLMVELFRDFYTGKYPPMTVTILKDLYELLEKVIDRCRDVANVTATVVLKHS